MRSVKPAPGCHRARPLFDRKGLAGEHRLVDVKVAGLQQDAVGGHQAAGREQHDVAGHHLFGGDLLRPAVAQHGGLDRHLGAQLLGGVVGAVLLEKAEQRAAQDDGQDDQRIHPVLRHSRHTGGKDQDEDNGALELVEEEPQRRGLFFRLQDVGANLRQAQAGLR